MGHKLRNAGRNEEAIACYESAAAMGSVSALNELGRVYLYGLVGVEKQPERAIPYFRAAAGRGDKYAMYNLGEVYRLGQGVAKDGALAVNWYRRSVAQGHRAANVGLGFAYWEGDGVEQNPAESLRHFRLAADAGDRNAMTWLGYLYQHGHGTPQDIEKARYWLEQAAEFEDSRAGGMLIRLYRRHYPPTEDTMAEMRKWADWIDEHGSARDMNAVAWFMATSKDETFLDGERALKLARKACETEPGNPAYLDTLAAAYARVGQFDAAAKTQQQAIDHDTNPDAARNTIGVYRDRLALYESGIACIDDE